MRDSPQLHGRVVALKLPGEFPSLQKRQRRIACLLTKTVQKKNDVLLKCVRVQYFQRALLFLQLGLNGKTKVRTFRKCHSFRLSPLSGLFGGRGLGLLPVTGGNGIMNHHGSEAPLCLKARRQPEQRGGTLLWLGSHYRQSKRAGGLEIVTVK